MAISDIVCILFCTIQIAYGSGSVALSNKQRFVNFFRTIPKSSTFYPAMISLLQFFGWKRILFITQNENAFTFVSHIILLFKYLIAVHENVRNKCWCQLPISQLSEICEIGLKFSFIIKLQVCVRHCIWFHH